MTAEHKIINTTLDHGPLLELHISKLKELKRNKQQDKLHELSCQFFFGKHQDVQHEQRPTGSQTVEKGKPIACSSFDAEVLITDNQELAAELATVKDALEVEENGN